jgi:hypothetical protein
MGWYGKGREGGRKEGRSEESEESEMREGKE